MHLVSDQTEPQSGAQPYVSMCRDVEEDSLGRLQYWACWPWAIYSFNTAQRRTSKTERCRKALHKGNLMTLEHHTPSRRNHVDLLPHTALRIAASAFVELKCGGVSLG